MNASNICGRDGLIFVWDIFFFSHREQPQPPLRFFFYTLLDIRLARQTGHNAAFIASPDSQIITTSHLPIKFSCHQFDSTWRRLTLFFLFAQSHKRGRQTVVSVASSARQPIQRLHGGFKRTVCVAVLHCGVIVHLLHGVHQIPARPLSFFPSTGISPFVG